MLWATVNAPDLACGCGVFSSYDVVKLLILGQCRAHLTNPYAEAPPTHTRTGELHAYWSFIWRTRR